MSVFHTHAEMVSGDEFIDYLEELKSGSLAGAVGINRSLERLSTSLDSALEALQEARGRSIEGGGTISFVANALTWSSNLTIVFPGELGTVKSNVILASSISSLTANKVVYTILNRTSDGATIAAVVAANMAAFLATIAGQPNRLDYLILGGITAQGISLVDGRRIPNGQSLTSNGYVQSQYGQQTELTTVHEDWREDGRTFLTGGGNISWDASATSFAWTSPLVIEYPSSAGANRILTASSPQIIPAGSAMVVTRSRAPGGLVSLTPSIIALGSVPNADDTYIVAISKSDGKLYLRNGQSLTDGEVTQLGSLQTGVQWFSQVFGDGTQITDFTEGGTFPSRSYKVRTGELMVYRNGVKAKSSTAYWNGSFPSGSLVGSIADSDQYVEEDSAVGTGTRIFWLRDDGTARGHPAATHDPPWTWPDTDDGLEAFIGIQGQGPDFLAANSVVGSTTVDVTEPSPNHFQFAVKSPFSLGLLNSSTPSAVNPYATFSDFDLMSGFDVVWCTQGTTRAVETGGGVLRTNGVAYRSTATASRVSVLDSNIYPADTLTNNAWNYLYLYAGSSPGGTPRGVVAHLPPASAAWGVHPADSTYKFLSSVFVQSNQFRPFVKRGDQVTLGFDLDISTPFGALTFSGTGTFAAVDFTGASLPAGVRQARARMRVVVDTAAVSVGERVEIRTRVPGFTVFKSYFTQRGNAASLDFDLDLLLDQNDQVEFSGSADILSISSVVLLSYVEGRYTSADSMGA